MTTQSKPAQTNPNAFDTTFKHRVNACFDGEFLNLIDAINPSLERAIAIADLIEVACEVTTSDSFNRDTLWRAAQAIRLEINDAQILLNAYLEMEKPNKVKVANTIKTTDQQAELTPGKLSLLGTNT